MKNKLLLAFLPFLSFGQSDFGSCAKMHSTRKHQLKSNTLSIADISRSEKYDMHYVKLDLDMTYLNTNLAGSGLIAAKAKVDLDSALFELFSTYVISSVLVDGNPTGYLRTGTKMLVPINKLAGENFEIKVFYSGTPPNAATNPLGGAGITNDDSPSWGNQVTWSLSEPFSAMEWFPIKQSLTDKIDSIDTWFTVPLEAKAGSNGLLQQIVPVGLDKHQFQWKHRNLIDYYLISVAVAKYIDYTIVANPVGSGPVTIQNYIYDNPATLPNFQTRIDETVDFIELYAQKFGPYPFASEKYGHCMAPLGGGMEHQTMTTQGFFERSLTSHELAHQWWGDHVTCASWADIWVNEGFASYAEYIMLEELYPGDEIADMLDRHTNIKSDPAGSVWCEDSLNDGSIFSGRLTYDKGSSIIHTLRFLIGNDSIFFKTLKDYQSFYSNSTTKGLDFIQIAENVSGKNFNNFMQEWYFGEGFPTYSVNWNNPGSNVIVEINQTTSMPSVTPFFTNDLELTFERASLPDTIIRFSITSNSTEIVIPNIGNITNCTSIDPNNWICNTNGSIVKNPNLLSISENAYQESIQIFPNPTQGITNLSIDLEGEYELKIIGTDGRFLKSLNFMTEAVIDLSEESAGMYVFIIQNKKTGQKSHRLVQK